MLPNTAEDWHNSCYINIQKRFFVESVKYEEFAKLEIDHPGNNRSIQMAPPIFAAFLRERRILKKHILLLESEQGMERILTLLLKQANFRVSRCRKGESLLDGTDAGTVLFGESDLLIIDMAERGCEGNRLLRKLKTARSVPPMILITPYGNEALLERGGGPDSAIVLYAPFESAELMDCIARAIDKKSD